MTTPTRSIPGQLVGKFTADENGCWRWHSRRKDGYAQVSFEGRKWLAHRLMYTILVGDIPKELQLDHLCRVTDCVNPSHLEAVTPLVNTRRSQGNNAKTECPAGHLYTPGNTLNYGDRLHRECRACKYERNAKYLRKRPGYQPPSRRRQMVGAA
ncbi:HNH endonuclease [Gordonia phage Lozinak]|uniref:HNH endonuclease n=2 Tax=Smoothievirus smoothie TaxID=1982561 RepID=A0A2D1GFW6_9CAUD|nr:HNH endonuclease [Gordonia phage Smoothie]ANA86207.1 HNH endonuclease [Gordonia phage Smoothie]ATN90676.1 HNH endonuclease [Gordonia phage Lozinak]QKY79627.1 HNH endonuclease [Gordonia Phage Engineer]